MSRMELKAVKKTRGGLIAITETVLDGYAQVDVLNELCKLEISDLINKKLGELEEEPTED